MTTLVRWILNDIWWRLRRPNPQIKHFTDSHLLSWSSEVHYSIKLFLFTIARLKHCLTGPLLKRMQTVASCYRNTKLLNRVHPFNEIGTWRQLTALRYSYRHMDFDALKVSESKLATAVCLYTCLAPIVLIQSIIMSSAYKIQPTNKFLRTQKPRNCTTNIFYDIEQRWWDDTPLIGVYTIK